MTGLWESYNLFAVFFIILDVVLVAGFVYSLKKAWHFHPTYKAHTERAGRLQVHRQTMHDIVMKERWHSVITKFRTGTPEAARLSIIEADALVDTALKNMRIEGEHLADRLSNLDAEDLKSMPRIWRAHRMRNDLVHTSGFGISQADAERTMQDYEAFLKEIDAIE